MNRKKKDKNVNAVLPPAEKKPNRVGGRAQKPL